MLERRRHLASQPQGTGRPSRPGLTQQPVTASRGQCPATRPESQGPEQARRVSAACPLPTGCDAPGHPRARTDTGSETSGVFVPDLASVLPPVDRGVVSVLKTHLTGAFRKAVAARMVPPLVGKVHRKPAGKQSPSRCQKTCRKAVTVLDATKNVRDSQEEAKMSVVTGVWQKAMPALRDDLEGLRTRARKSVQMWGNRKRTEPEVEPAGGGRTASISRFARRGRAPSG